MPVSCIWYWPRDFVLRTRDFEQPKSYRRASISLVLAGRSRLALTCAGQRIETQGAVLLGPAVERGQLSIAGEAVAESGWILDYAPGTPAFLRLRAALAGRSVWQWDEGHANKLLQQLDALGERPEPGALRSLHARIAQECGVTPRAVDPRVQKALGIIDEYCLDEIQMADVASKVGLSESRLRSLVRGHLGCNLAQYARWAAAWRVVLNWQPGMTLTDAAHAGGFHDLAHANHAANDMFGMSPSRALDRQRLLLVDCRLSD